MSKKNENHNEIFEISEGFLTEIGLENREI